MQGEWLRQCCSLFGRLQNRNRRNRCEGAFGAQETRSSLTLRLFHAVMRATTGRRTFPGCRHVRTRLLLAETTPKVACGECMGGPMALTVGQRTALENAGDAAVSAKLKMAAAAPSFVIKFPGAHITRQDVESWVAERKVARAEWDEMEPHA